MRALRFLVACAALLWMSLPAVCQGRGFVRAAELVPNSSGFGDQSWELLAAEREFRLDGRGKLRSNTGRTAVLPLSENCFISGQVYSSSHHGDLLLFFEESDAESAGGVLLRVETRTLQVLWKHSFSAFNIGRPLIAGDAVYLTGYASAAKVALSNGRSLWQSVELGKSSGDEFAAFGLPELSHREVILKALERKGQSAGSRGWVKEPGVVWLDRATGQVLRMQPTRYSATKLPRGWLGN